MSTCCVPRENDNWHAGIPPRYSLLTRTYGIYVPSGQEDQTDGDRVYPIDRGEPFTNKS